MTQDDNKLARYEGGQLDTSKMKAAQAPLISYLSKLGTDTSRRSVLAPLNRIARKYLQQPDARSVNWAKINDHVIVEWIRAQLIAEGLAPASCNLALSALKGVLKECWRQKLIPAEEWERIRDVPSVKGYRLPKGRAVTPKELRALFQVCSDAGSVSGVRNAALLAVLYGGGLRRSEVVALNIGDWNSKDATLRVLGKGNKERLVYLKNGSIAALEAWLRYREGAGPNEPLFVRTNKGGRVSSHRLASQTILDLTKALVARSGVEDFSPHDLRRSFVSDLLDAGADISSVQQMAGHASVSTTAAYDRRGEAAKSRAATLLSVPYVPVEVSHRIERTTDK